MRRATVSGDGLHTQVGISREKSHMEEHIHIVLQKRQRCIVYLCNYYFGEEDESTRCVHSAFERPGADFPAAFRKYRIGSDHRPLELCLSRERKEYNVYTE